MGQSSYEMIIDLKRPKSAKHSPMPILSRAAQFAPFAALTGYGESISESARLTEVKEDLGEEETEILNQKIQYLMEHLSEIEETEITYFVPDLLKDGGCYYSLKGKVRVIDPAERVLKLRSGEEISLDDIKVIRF